MSVQLEFMLFEIIVYSPYVLGEEKIDDKILDTE